ncbi:hypothetical protein [Clavibacter michiganensis]|uniref:hypothetical protein n=1 Tax=Clavibacter michiganensis TaxID=28447 RepID=UPI002931681F|nr:hypothetical protein [Clavibacter michiganensis]
MTIPTPHYPAVISPTEDSPTTEASPAGVAGLDIAPHSLARAANASAELAHAQRQTMELSARVFTLEAELQRARSEQINGSDPRMERFWERAGRIADAADFCAEYDRLAEAMDGPRREREYDVTIRATVSVRFTHTVMARDAEDACEIAENEVRMGQIEEAVAAGHAYDWDLSETDAERAG